MKSFQLNILTPERVFYQGECVSLIVPISDGMLGIMADREPITAAIGRGEAYYTTTSGEKVLFAVFGGMVDVTREGVQMLCEEALLPEEIDEEKENEELRLAQAQLAQKQRSRDYAISKIMMKNAINNLRVKHKRQS